MSEKTLTQQMYEAHEANSARVRQLQTSAGTQNLLIELMDRLDRLERQLKVVQDYDQETWRRLFTLKGSLHEIGEKLRDATDS